MSFDRTNATDLTTLRDRIQTTPALLAAADVTANLLALLNLPENNPNVADEVAIPFDEFPIIDAIDEINKAEYLLLDGVHKTVIDTIIQAGVARSDENGALGVAYFGPVKKLFKKAFNNIGKPNNTSITWLAVKDDRMRQASIAEADFGRDTVLVGADVTEALHGSF